MKQVLDKLGIEPVNHGGFSGEWLGPPNYHGYQTALAQIHRERFGHIDANLAYTLFKSLSLWVFNVLS